MTSRRQLEELMSLSDAEAAFFDSEIESDRLPFAATDYFLSLVSDAPDDPIRRQIVPTADEFSRRSYERDDPLSEDLHSPVPRLVHRYPDRVLILITDRCAVHCRHCFRRRFAGSGRGTIGTEDLSAIREYLAAHTEVREILLSGGDPFMVPVDRLESIVTELRRAGPDRILRFATRVPVAAPELVTAELVRMVQASRPAWIVVQVNHPRELTAVAGQRLSAFVDAGVPVVSQTVLLRGVNDSVEVLEELFSRLVGLMVKPYYLFQGDLAPGTAHFRVSIERGLEIMRGLRRRLSGLATPTYAVDCPGGGGKIPLTEQYILGVEGDSYVLESPEGGRYRYPIEPEST